MSTERCRGNKRKLAIFSDSEEDTKTTEDDIQVRRHSSRIYNKQQRPEFRLPSRDELWKEIPSLTTKTKLKNLSPKKTVNNFTKVYNSYNYDDYEDTSDDESTPDDSSDSDNLPEQTQHRIKNYHKRVQLLSSSSDEDDNKIGGSDQDHVQNRDLLPKKQDRKGLADLTTEPENKQNDDMNLRFDQDEIAHTENTDHEDSDESEVITPSKNSAHLRNRSVLESDDESIKNDDDAVEDVSGNSDSHSESSSESSTDLNESGRHRLANQKMKQINMFQKLRDARERKKSILALEGD